MRPRVSRPPGDATACPHRPPCPGCPRFGEHGIAPAAHAALTGLACAHGLPEVAVVCGKLSAFRSRARLAIRGRVGSPKLGLFATGTHRVVHIPDCRVQHPLINRVAAVVRRALVESRVSCYSEKAHFGLARYLQAVVERRTQTAQVVIVANSADAEPLAGCLDSIRTALGAQLHSLWFNSHLERSNAILGSEFRRWCGPACVVEHFGGPAVHYPPGAFGQNNLEIAHDLIEYLRTLVPYGASVAEFYAGVGAIGLSLLPRVGRILINEVSPQSLLGLELGCAELPEDERAKITIHPGPAAAAAASAVGASVVIADPPRKGLDPELIEHLVRYPPERFIYIGCGLESLLEDTSRLTAHGRLRLASLRAFNLMPFTEHVETVASFEPG